MKHITLLLFCTLLTLSNTISAHDFWIEAAPFYQKKNSHLDLTLNVGENMKGEQLPNIPSWYKNFEVITANGLKNIEGEIGSDPAGSFYSNVEGIYAIGYQSDNTLADFDGKKFTTYLEAQGLEKIIAQREKLGESEKNAPEFYSRNVKTLVKIGTENTVNFYDYDFGYPLNIKPMQNPYKLNVGDKLQVQVTFNQKPLPNFLLRYQIKDKKDFHPSIRTDEQGYATVTLAEKGIWMLHGVEMIRSNFDDVDWESFWASLTFEMR